MNKNLINNEIKAAYDALRNVGIVEQNKEGKDIIKKTYRGQISSFGAAVTMGSLLPAIAFFSENGGSDVERSKLMKAILEVLQKKRNVTEKTLLDYVLNHKEDECKEEIVNAAIALKLSMNLYEFEK